MVQVLPDGKVVLCHTRRKNLSYCSSNMFGLQGSVLGPLLFVVYTAELADLAAKYGVKLHAFTDDNQLHVHCDLSNVLSSVKMLEQCISTISQWIMSANRLKLNADKTELMWAGCSEWYLPVTGLQRRPKQSWDALTQSAPISLILSTNCPIANWGSTLE